MIDNGIDADIERRAITSNGEPMEVTGGDAFVLTEQMKDLISQIRKYDQLYIFNSRIDVRCKACLWIMIAERFGVLGNENRLIYWLIF